MPPRARHLAPVLVSVILGVPALAPAATPTPRPLLAAKLTSCEIGSDGAGGTAVFLGSMPAVKGAKRLWLRFDLQRRLPGDDDWERLSAPTFGEWEKSRPGVSGFVYSKRVEGLAAPAAYRSVVRFRWVDARGRTVRSARRVTAACRQPDPRPNLAITRIRPATSPSGPVVEVSVRNTGRSDTLAPAVVTLAVAGEAQPSQTIPPLGPGVTATVTFPLLACPPGGVLEAAVDPADGIDEALETDNLRTRECA